MSFKRPIFSARGLPGAFGKANGEVCNLWTESAVAVRDNAEGIAWATAQLVQGRAVKSSLCELLSATLVTPNRWSYQVRIWIPPEIGGITPGSDARFTYAVAWNLREYHNSATMVDGTDVNLPASTFGPVGSHWDPALGASGAWTITELEAKVHLYVAYSTAGKAWPYFDRPNPFRCTDLANNAFSPE